MSNYLTNLNILEKLHIYVKNNPELNFHQILDLSECSPIEYIKDVSNPEIGRYASLDRRNEDSVKTLSRINNKIRINIKN